MNFSRKFYYRFFIVSLNFFRCKKAGNCRLLVSLIKSLELKVVTRFSMAIKVKTLGFSL